MPRSVTTPVRWVVRTTEPERRVTRLFCMPMANDRRLAASVTTNADSSPPWTSNAAP